jgi:xylulokinase
MNQSVLMGLDLGTSGAKAAILDGTGQLLGLAQEEYAFQHPQAGWSEIDPGLVWEQACRASRQAIAAASVEPWQIAALGLSVIGETVMPVDEHGQPVYPAIESMDVRDKGYARFITWWQEHFGAQEIFRRTSYPLNALPSAIKILWWQVERPDVYRQTAKFVTFQDYALWRLVGQPYIDYSLASRTMLFDVHTKRWMTDFLAEMGLEESRLSPPCEAAAPVGQVTAAAARATGLREGTLVVAGAHDQACAALGVGAVREGVAADGTGSVEAIAIPTRIPIGSPAMLARGQGSQCHVRGDLYLALGFHLAAGSLVRWVRDQLLNPEDWARAEREHRSVYDLMTEAAQGSPPGARGLLVLPHIVGAGTGRAPALNAGSRGVLLGLGQHHNKADLSRAVFEGITYEAKIIIESLEESGIPISQLVVTGGGARSPFWLQLKADIFQKRIVVPAVTEASLLGAALLAGVGAGLFPDLETAVDRCCRVRARYEPNARLSPAYERMWAIYRDVYPAVIDLNERLSRAAQD